MNQHIKCLKIACETLNIPYTSIGRSGVFLSIVGGNTPYYFIANEVPFNNQIVSRIITDKGYTYDLLSDIVRMPQTLSLLDPDGDELFRPYVEYKTHEAIAEKIMSTFPFPVILKKNSGSQGMHVFRCTNKEEILAAVAQIFSQTSVEYDHVLLAQECIQIQKEFRVTVFQKEVVLVYEKDFSQAKFVGNLSPLHWEGAKAKIIDDQVLIDKIKQFVQPIFTKLDLEYGGLDIALDEKGELCLFEINSKPAYNYLIESNGDEPLVGLYKRMLEKLTQAQTS